MMKVLPFGSVCLLTSLILFLNIVPVSGFQSGSTENSYEILQNETIHDKSTEINNLNKTFQALLERGDLEGGRLVAEELLKKTNFPSINKNYLSDSYYFIGVYYFFIKKTNEAIRYFNLSISLREEIGLYDHHYSKALYNLGVISNVLGDFKGHEDFSLRSVEVEKKIFGENSPLLLSTYLSLITAYMDLQEYGKALTYANIALKIANTNIAEIDLKELAFLYSNIGVTYMMLADYSKAKIYLDKAESIFKTHQFNLNESYINLMNSLAITNGELGLTEKSREFYEKGISLANSVNSSFTDNIVNSYAISLGNSGERQKGELLLQAALNRARKNYGETSRNYFLLLTKYADYLREFSRNNKGAVECYEQCMDYLKLNSHDLFLKNIVYTGYSLSLTETGQSGKALEIIQSLLFPDELNEKIPILDNPEDSLIKPDKRSLLILKTKYKILWDIHRQSSGYETLEAASVTAELIVRMLEKVRINISEEESRLFLGDRYRESYINAIRDFNLLYVQSGDHKYLEKAFEYSEKSKVAGLLASTRELKAVQFHIPSDIADLEKELQRNISLLNARIGEESIKEKPDAALVSNWKENLIRTTLRRDSLITVFEKQYPDYYAIKYNTQMVDLNSISGIIGRNSNYLNYISSDSLLYVFVANRKHRQLLAIPIDTNFYLNINKFRNLLACPSPSDNARLTFQEFKSTGNFLYTNLIVPVVPYLISDQLLISPDNLLSFIPFETIPISTDSAKDILYRNLTYLMNEFDISYTYSATFMAESGKSTVKNEQRLIAFAPDYSSPIEIESVINRQAATDFLPELPFAKLEAEYVVNVTGGVLYENSEAKESVYKKEAGKYDIIHMAMHTLLNDTDPMYSTLIFSKGNDTIEDRYLKTYEVYGVPLKANMVVLSSCNTGTGLLYSGEGILSLARGFMYSGSKSVVMSMWEIEDRSGTEIVKKFYDNLKKGNTKSMALRKARISYLKQADQLRSHPYFWSALIVYGNNSPLYYSGRWIIPSSVILVIAFIIMYIYLRRRRYS